MLGLSWTGSWLVFEGSFSLSVVALVASSFLFIRLSEPRTSVILLSWLLCVLVFFFVGSGSFLCYYFLLELVLLPLLFLLYSYGAQPQKIGASSFLILYSVLSSIPLLWVLLHSQCLAFVGVGSPVQCLVLLLLALGFLIKLPAYLLHSWLPRVHVEAPTSASVVLAALLLKIGAWGLFRLLPELFMASTFMWAWLSLLGMLLGPLACLLSSDFKSLAAYSSVVHMGLLLCALLSASSLGASGGFLVLVGHGYVSATMFWLVGAAYQFLGVRLVYLASGLWSSMLSFSLVFAIVLLCNSGVPPSSNFFAEVVGLSTVFVSSSGLCGFLGVYYFLGLVYSVLLVASLLGGSRGSPAAVPMVVALPFLLLSVICVSLF